MEKIAIIASTDRGVVLGKMLQKELQKAVLISTRASDLQELEHISSIADFNIKISFRTLGLNQNSFNSKSTFL